jgi:Ca2+:H+ antiporter
LKNLQKIFYGLALLFIPSAIILDKIAGVPQPLLFFLAAVAIFPLAALLVQATEQLATYTGDTIGGLLNATFGNAPELIIALVALKAGLYDMVKASIIGAILANMLLGLGAAFFAGGLKRHVQEFNPTAARNYVTLMLLAVISLHSQYVP